MLSTKIENFISNIFTSNNYNKIPKKAEHLFSSDILIEICKFIKDYNDYINFSKTSKFINEILNSYHALSISEIFKFKRINLNLNIPIYLPQLNLISRANHFNDINNLQNFKNLKYLRIEERVYEYEKLKDKNRFNDDILQYLINLEELFLENCYFIKGTSFKKLKKLKKLKIIGHCIKNQEFYSNLENLKYLNLVNCSFDIENINLPKLESLKLIYSSIIDNKQDQLKKFKNFKVSSFKINFSFLKELLNLEYLTIKEDRFYCTNLGDEHLQNLKYLKKLIINVEDKNFVKGICFINFNQLEYLDGSFPNLENNNLQYLKKLKQPFKIKILENV
ncbi:hypothetical protein ABK040_013648 [Willaertia magna]